MKFDLKLTLAACLHAFLLAPMPGHAAGAQAFEISVAALSLPNESSGLVHWRGGDTATTPLQLSTRYFSERVKLPGNVIQFYQEPVAAGPPANPAPEPLVTLRIPEGQNLIYVVLSSDLDKEQQIRWRGSMFSARDWRTGSMKVFNACPEPVGITAGKKKIQLNQGKSVDFHSREWGGESFPVKIYRLQPELKTIFSSTWRVADGRRELLFIGTADGAVSLRSLMDIGGTPDPKP
jgi:hypothetical protein